MGNFDFFIRAVYVVILGVIGGLMFVESLRSLRRSAMAGPVEAHAPGSRKFSDWFQSLPLQMEFRHLGMRTSAVFPFVAGGVVGLLAAIMGVGGGFIMVPTMIYIIGMPTVMAVGTDLFQIVLTSANVTLQQAMRNHTVDLMFAVILFCGSVFGAQLGARVSKKLRGEQIRILLAVIVLVVMVKLLFDLILTPDNVIAFVTVSGGH